MESLQQRRNPALLVNPAEQPLLFGLIEMLRQKFEISAGVEVYISVSGRMDFFPATPGNNCIIVYIGLPLFVLFSVEDMELLLAHALVSATTHHGFLYRKILACALERTWSRGASTGNAPDLFQRASSLCSLLMFQGAKILTLIPRLRAGKILTRGLGTSKFHSGMRSLQVSDGLVRDYWELEYSDAIAKGIFAPFLEGFCLFLGPEAYGGLNLLRMSRSHSNKEPEWNTARIVAALDWIRNPSAVIADSFDFLQARPAIAMLNQVSDLESDLLFQTLGFQLFHSLTRLSWEEVPTKGKYPYWEFEVQKNRSRLTGICPEHLPALLSSIDPGNRLEAARPGVRDFTKDAVSEMLFLTSAAVAVLLIRRGAHLEWFPGGIDVLVHQGVRVEPFLLFWKLLNNEILPADWERDCRQLSIYGVDLGSL